MGKGRLILITNGKNRKRKKCKLSKIYKKLREQKSSRETLAWQYNSENFVIKAKIIARL